MLHGYLRIARGLKYRRPFRDFDKTYHDLLLRSAEVEQPTDVFKEMQHLLSTSSARAKLFFSEPQIAEYQCKENYELVENEFRRCFGSMTPAEDTVNKCKTDQVCLDNALELGCFNGVQQTELRSILEASITDDNLASVTAILLSLMDEPPVKSLRSELVGLAQLSVTKSRTTRVLETLLFYANRPLRAQKDAGATLVAAALENNTAALAMLLEAGICPDSRDKSGKTALMLTAAAGHVEAARMLLNGKANVVAVSPFQGMTALGAAVQSGNEKMIELMLVGSLANEPNRRYGTPLQLAAAQGSVTIVKVLVESAANVNYPAPVRGRNALQAAAAGGFDDVVRYLLSPAVQAEVNSPPAPESFTALALACLGGHLSTVRILLERSADVNLAAAASSGLTALQAAALGGDTLIVKLLLECGADVNAQASYHGLTAIQAASKSGNVAIFDELYNAGATTTSLLRPGGTSALQAAAFMGHTEIINRLLAMPEVDINQKPGIDGGFTALQAACRKPNAAIAEKLVAAGAEVNAEPANFRGRTALQAAAESGASGLVIMLIQAGAEVNAAPSEEYGMTALQAACLQGHLDVAILLHERGADIRAPPSIIGGRTALQAASESGNHDLVAFLLRDGAFANELPSYQDGISALRAAELGGFETIKELLIDAGANSNFLDDADTTGGLLDDWSLQYRPGWTVDPAKSVSPSPTDLGSRTSQETPPNPALSSSASIAAVSDWSALATAASLGDEVAIESLLANPITNPINSPPALLNGRTPLQAAAENGHDAVVAQLLLAGADPNGPAAEIGGLSALEAAAKGGHLDVVERLLQAKAAVDGDGSGSRNEEADGRPTALQLAAKAGHGPVVEAIIREGANVNMGRRGIGGLTALEGALEAGWDNVVSILRRNGATAGD
ncbi:MAG: hypothetical protein Q9200_001362 [Gallowayella weberi]